MTAQLPAEYRGLVDVLKDRVPSDYRPIMAHQCRYHGRAFVHLKLKNESGLLSLAITRKDGGETFGGLDIQHDGVQRFQIAALPRSRPPAGCPVSPSTGSFDRTAGSGGPRGPGGPPCVYETD